MATNNPIHVRISLFSWLGLAMIMPPLAKVFGLVSWPWCIVMLPWLIPVAIVVLIVVNWLRDGGELHYHFHLFRLWWLGLLLPLAKLFGLVSWPWWVVLLPWLVPGAIIAVIVGSGLAASLVTGRQLRFTPPSQND